MTIPGLFQHTPLLISSILTYAAKAHGRRKVVSRLVDEPVFRYTYADWANRTAQAVHALERLGVKSGDRVTSMAWNTHRHLELFYGVPGMGAVLHTANPRLSDEQIVYTVNHAESRVLLFDRTFIPLIERLKPQFTTVTTYVLMAAQDEPGYLNYETLLAAESPAIDWPQIDEYAGAFLCYTSGTTGDPKGVLYNHRGVVLHAMAGGMNSAFGFDAFDVVMPCSSLYHANAWGLPFSAPLCGAAMILPCEKMDGASLHELIDGEGVTFTGGVPTIWTMYLNWLDQNGKKPKDLKTIVIGGSAVPFAMAQAFKDRFGINVRQLWGMTETAPIGVVSTPTPELAALGEQAMNEAIWSRQGRIQFGIELEITDDDGNPLPHDGETSGALKVRGPWVISRYYRKDADCTDADGWFDTGDIATLDENGFMRITDRAKDVIKSGGEWISSIDLENIAVGCPGVKIAAVVGVPHPKWEERPILVIEQHEGVVVSKDEVLHYLASRIVKWWTPDDVVFAPVPLTATGKIDKKVLRVSYQHHLTK